MLHLQPPIANKVTTGGAAQALAFSPDGGEACYDITLTANLTLSFTGGIPGVRQAINLITRNPTGGFTLTFPGGIKWHNNAAPAVATTAGTLCSFTFVTTDGGATIIAK